MTPTTLIQVGVLYAGALVLSVLHPQGTTAALYLVSAGLGSFVGLTELISRYRDNPLAPLRTKPGWVYIVVNGAAAAAAFGLIRLNDLFADGTLPQALSQVLVAALGSMAFFRSALFTVRLGETDVAVGPAALLQAVLSAADRACDRLLATSRSTLVMEIMRDVRFEHARSLLPLHAFQLMQNVSLEEQTGIAKDIATLAQEQVEEEIKTYNLGLLLLRLLGEDVLRRMVEALKPDLARPSKGEMRIVNTIAQMPDADVAELLDIAVTLVGLRRPPSSETARLGAAASALAARLGNGGTARKVALAIDILQVFGRKTLLDAIALLRQAQAGGVPVDKDLSLDDLLGASPGGTPDSAPGAAPEGGPDDGSGAPAADQGVVSPAVGVVALDRHRADQTPEARSTETRAAEMRAAETRATETETRSAEARPKDTPTPPPADAAS
ncbi:hypothetical protein [Rhodocista pekingensis]|uniref:DUF2254 domain-containing protein n=1 Tax=Rhodocista pekingensis TaxID=201185 RepID=A0ABW2KYN7_9PROT